MDVEKGEIRGETKSAGIVRIREVWSDRRERERDTDTERERERG